MSDEPIFRARDHDRAVAVASPLQIHLRLAGHLSESALVAELNRADHELLGLQQAPILLVNCLTMTGYDSAARGLFISWNSRQKKKFLCVAIITENKLWHMLVSSMALASGQKMRAFHSLAQAAPWMTEQWLHEKTLA
jgi:hypothetical protein